jgi:hypothetical protein
LFHDKNMEKLALMERLEEVVSSIFDTGQLTEVNKLIASLTITQNVKSTLFGIGIVLFVAGVIINFYYVSSLKKGFLMATRMITILNV